MTSPATGTRIGPYQLLAPIGAGGMGEVWKARDTRLDRVVAIKFSRDAFNERFRHEARAIAALNHPNIAQIYDVGDNYLVMEYVDGEPVRKPDNVRKLLDIAEQIADGLAAAHAAGFVHRDLKPDNILITKPGRVKILDFGIAKQMLRPGPEDGTRTSLTDPGSIVGTTAYMSPEQARGQELDARSDQFSFGLILYELATAKHPFQRPSAPETLTAIIREDAEPLPASIPTPLRWTAERLLAKDPDDRYASTRDLFAELRVTRMRLSEVSGVAVPAAPARARRVKPAVIIATLCLIVVMLSLIVAATRTSTTPNYRFTPFAATSADESGPVWSPDGRMIAYVERAGGTAGIMVKNVDGANAAVPLVRGSVLQSLSWSPDGERIYYLSYSNSRAATTVMSVARAGGQPSTVLSLKPFDESRQVYSSPVLSPDGKTLALLLTNSSLEKRERRLVFSSPPGAVPRVIGDPLPCCTFPTFMTWSPDGGRVLVYMSGRAATTLWSITRDGRAKAVIQFPAPVEPTFSWLADNRHFVITADAGLGQDRGLHVVDADSGTISPLLSSATRLLNPSASRDGHRIAYVTRSRLYDLLEIPLSGDPPRPLVLSQLDQHSVAFSPKRDAFAFVRLDDQIIVRNRDNGEERVLVSARDFRDVMSQPLFSWLEYSPDGERIVFSCLGCEDEYSLWTVPLAGGAPARVTGGADGGWGASWSPDGQRIAYNSSGEGRANTLVTLRIGSGEKPERIGGGCYQPSWSPSGEWILCPSLNRDLKVLSPDGKQTRVLGETAGRAAWSRDGRVIYNTRRDGERVTLERLNPETGRAQKISDLPLDFQPASPIAQARLSVSADGKSLAVSVRAGDSDIWILDGFEPPRRFWDRLWPLRQ